MKHYADLNRFEKEFAVGDLVYLKLQLYIQSSVAPRSDQKPSFWFYGPFKVLARVGTIAYRLQLPDDCKIHPVVHVSQLKRHIPPSVTVEDDIAQIPNNPVAAVQPVEFLDSRILKKEASMLSQIQVRWAGLPHSLTTWEEAVDLRRRFPGCAAWGQAAFRGGGNVSVSKRHRRSKSTIGHPAIASATTSSGVGAVSSSVSG